MSTRKPKPTAKEKFEANKLQAHGSKSRKGGSTKVAATFTGADFFQTQKEFRTYDNEPNWIDPTSIFGQPFWIVKVWSFETVDYGSKVGFEVKLDPKAGDDQTALFSLTWNEERESMVKAFKKLRRGTAGATIGPMTFQLQEAASGQQPYRKIVAYSVEIAAETMEIAKLYAPSPRGKQRGKRPASSGVRKTRKAAKAKPVDDIGI